MKTLIVFSLKGGTGRTTVACNLGAQLIQQGCRCVLVDTDPQNALGLHLGMQVGERFGIARKGLSEQDVAAYRRRNLAQLPHLPFGHCNLEELLEIEHLRMEDYAWLTRRIVHLIPQDTELLIMDAPAGLSRWAQDAVRAADLVLVVLQPDAASYATIPMTEALLNQRKTRLTSAYLVNQMDSRRPLSCDVHGAMGHLLGDGLLPFTIPLDEAMREAFAQQMTLLSHAPQSQAALCFADLATWVTERLAVEV